MGASSMNGRDATVAMSLIVLLSLGSAACYVLATVAMKRWDAIGVFWALCLIAAALTGAVLLGIEALRHARLSHVFIMILGFEASLALLCGWLFFHESYAFLEIMRLLLIVVGVAMTRLRAVAGGGTSHVAFHPQRFADASGKACGTSGTRLRHVPVVV
jgi:multidrug transporter EmrE-like cation transporter